MLIYGFDSCMDYALFVKQKLLEQGILSKDFFNDGVFLSGDFFSFDFKFPGLQRSQMLRSLANYALVPVASLSVESNYDSLSLYKRFRIGSTLNNLEAVKDMHCLGEGEDWKLSVILDDIGFVDDDYAVNVSRNLANALGATDYKEVLRDSYTLPLSSSDAPVLMHAYKENLYQGSALYLNEEARDVFSSGFLDELVKTYNFLSDYKKRFT